jgi:hypothetical protein
MWAAPQENVVETSPVYYPYLSYGQLLYFEDIERAFRNRARGFAAEEAKRQEILTWPGVRYASYNITIIDDPTEPPE